MSRVPSFLRVLVGFLVLAGSATVCFTLAILLLPSRIARIKLGNYYGKFIGRIVVWLAGARLEILNKERLDGSFPAIYIANHASTLDAFLSIWLCPIGGCGVMKKEVAKVPFFGWAYLLSGHLRIDRSKHAKAVASLTEVGELVKKNRLGIWIMPEGTRSLTGRLLPLKSGFVHLAIATGLPVVPVILHGVHRVWPLGGLKVFGGPIKIEVLEPIATGAWQTETASRHAEEVHDVMVAALPPEQRPLPVAVAA
jgi:1-acyl-sn-glycerol-3-phosphate acyltransferase